MYGCMVLGDDGSVRQSVRLLCWGSSTVVWDSSARTAVRLWMWNTVHTLLIFIIISVLKLHFVANAVYYFALPVNVHPARATFLFPRVSINYNRSAEQTPCQTALLLTYLTYLI